MPRALDSIYFSIIPADTQGPCRILAVRVLFRKKRKKCLTKRRSSGILCLADGRLAQLARASAWRAEGHRFESYIVHHEKPSFVNLTKEGFSMISVPVRTGDISSIWYRTFVRWYMPAAYGGTDIISRLRSKHIIRLAVYHIAIAIYHRKSQRLMI